jgi:hypothetical protein
VAFPGSRQNDHHPDEDIIRMIFIFNERSTVRLMQASPQRPIMEENTSSNEKGSL